MDDNIVPNILDSPLSKTLSLILNKIKPTQPLDDTSHETFWMTLFIKDSGLNPFSHVQQNKTHTITQPLDDTSNKTFWIKPF
jgi:hypothetical protein